MWAITHILSILKKKKLLSVPIEQPYYAGAQEHVYLLLIFKIMFLLSVPTE